MRLSRTDLVPVLTIVAGGVIGGSLSFSLLGSRSGDEAEQMTAEARVEILAKLQEKAAESRAELDRMVRLRRDVEEAIARAADLAREQRDIVAGMDRLAEARGGPGSEAGRRLFERKEAMHDEIADLEREILRLSSEAQGKTSDLFGEAARTIEDDKLKERVRYSRGLIGVQDREYTREFEAETTRVVEELVQELESVTRRGTPDEYNLVLGSRRAESVEDFLLHFGISVDRFRSLRAEEALERVRSPSREGR